MSDGEQTRRWARYRQPSGAHLNPYAKVLDEIERGLEQLDVGHPMGQRTIEDASIELRRLLEAAAVSAAGFAPESEREKPAYYRKAVRQQQQRCYAWERVIRPVEPHPIAIPIRKPFTPEFLAFFAEAWAFGYGLYGSSLVKKWPNFIALDRPPRLKYMNRLRRSAGHSGFGFNRAGHLLPTITLGAMGMTRPTLLHETAHILTMGDGHGPDFCRVALSLYVRFLGVDEAKALELAADHAVQIA